MTHRSSLWSSCKISVLYLIPPALPWIRTQVWLARMLEKEPSKRINSIELLEQFSVSSWPIVWFDGFSEVDQDF